MKRVPILQRKPIIQRIPIKTPETYLDTIFKIKAVSEKVLYDGLGREIWKIPHNMGYILYRPYKDGLNYCDGCDYQRLDNSSHMATTFWTCSTPQEFLQLFLKEKPYYDRNEPCISQKQLKAKKTTKFYNKNGVTYWFDDKGLFYVANKHFLPTKKDREEYAKFKDNPKTVYCEWGTGTGILRHRAWFDSFDDFKEFFEQERTRTPSYLGGLQYKLLKTGYKKPEPSERKVITVMPYIDLNNELKCEHNDTANDNYCIHAVACTWCKQMEGIKYFGEPLKNINWVEDVIKHYIEYINLLK